MCKFLKKKLKIKNNKTTTTTKNPPKFHVCKGGTLHSNQSLVQRVWNKPWLGCARNQFLPFVGGHGAGGGGFGVWQGQFSSRIMKTHPGMTHQGRFYRSGKLKKRRWVRAGSSSLGKFLSETKFSFALHLTFQAAAWNQPRIFLFFFFLCQLCFQMKKFRFCVASCVRKATEATEKQGEQLKK